MVHNQMTTLRHGGVDPGMAGVQANKAGFRPALSQRFLQGAA